MLDTQLRKLEKKYGKYAINNLMLYIVATMLMLYIGQIVASKLPNVDGSIFSFLYFDRDKILHGQVWRLITFVFLPPMENPLFEIFELYFCYLFGSSLESRWGSFRFNVYYFLGTLGSIIAGFITGYASNNYLNLSLLIAFAISFPDFEIMLFFFIPVKMKWIAIIDAAFLIWNLILGSMSIKLLILFSFANLLIFFAKDLYINVRYIYRKKFAKKKTDKPEKRAKNIDIKRK